MIKYTPENPVFSSEINIVERADLINSDIHNTSIKQLIGNEVALKNQLDSCIGNVEGDKPQFTDGIKSEDVVSAINEVFLLGSEKKAQLAANLTAMGIQVSASDTWDVLLDKILDMTDTSNDTVTAPALLEGYTAHDATGGQIEGEMPEMAAVTVDAVSTTQDNDYTYLGLPGGHYDENSKVRTKNSNMLINTKNVKLEINQSVNWSTFTKTIILNDISQLFNVGIYDTQLYTDGVATALAIRSYSFDNNTKILTITLYGYFKASPSNNCIITLTYI
ncbi:MAG: hypothetical protein K2P63_02660 [Lachnospiraceae bacterium]|nr:hypothetical protein [Lachnospiraceae bacterium]